MQLTVRTRADAKPQGKPRVALLCHPDDYGRWAGELASLILRYQDCAVVFGGELESVQSETLTTYQLVVVAVTHRLLATQNAVRDGVVEAAAEVHVPVLPIVVEPGLDELYVASPFGALQFLDRATVDATALPFERKLAQHLEKTLVGAKLAERIRGAFDGYLFLSYRKKDRSHARELMRLIHRDARCRDIAIWYDEYLELGEDFNDSIRAALDKSAVFVLVVTPNILERPNGKPNYVMAEEYPAAREKGKPIEPVEMLRVDWQQLAAFFEGIGAPVDPADDGQMQAFACRVEEALGVPSDRPFDPEHYYLIGVAYLDGVDVETDAARAVELISTSAGAGYLEALTHLAMMYRIGKGVRQDLELSARYGERALELLMAACEKRRASAIAGAGSCADAAAEAGSCADEAAGERGIADDHLAADLREQAESLSTTYLELSRPREAANALRRAIGVLSGQPSGTQPRYNMVAGLLAQLAYAEFRAGDFAAARDSALQASARSEALPPEDRDLVVLKALDVLSDASWKLGNVQEALDSRERFVERLRLMEEASGERERRLDTAIGLGKLAESCVAAQQHDRAIALMSAAVEKLSPLLDEFGIAFCGRNLVNALCKLGDAENAKGMVDEAAAHYGQAVALARRVVAEMGTLGSYRNLSLALHRLAVIRNAAGDAQQAAELIDEAIRIRRALCKQGELPSDGAYLGKYLQFATALALGRDDETAKALGAEGLNALNGYLAVVDDADALRDRAMCAHYLGLAYRRWGTLEDAARNFAAAARDDAVLVERHGCQLDRENLCAELLAWGDALQEGGSDQQIRAATEPYERASDIAYGLALDTGKVDHAEMLFTAWGKLGLNCILCQRYGEAKDCLSGALGLVPGIAPQHDTPNLRYSIAEDYGHLALALEGMGVEEEAREAHESAQETAKDLVDKTHQAAHFKLYLLLAEQAGDFERREGQALRARAAYITAAPYAEVLARQVGGENAWAGYISLLVKASWVPADDLEAAELLQIALAACGDFAAACPESRVAKTMETDILSRLATMGFDAL